MTAPTITTDSGCQCPRGKAGCTIPNGMPAVGSIVANPRRPGSKVRMRGFKQALDPVTGVVNRTILMLEPATGGKKFAIVCAGPVTMGRP